MANVTLVSLYMYVNMHASLKLYTPAHRTIQVVWSSTTGALEIWIRGRDRHEFGRFGHSLSTSASSESSEEQGQQ